MRVVRTTNTGAQSSRYSIVRLGSQPFVRSVGLAQFHKFLDVFDKVFVLDIDVETLNRRLDGRPNEPGFEPTERALVLRFHHTREYLPVGINIETAGTLRSVVDDILAQLT